MKRLIMLLLVLSSCIITGYIIFGEYKAHLQAAIEETGWPAGKGFRR